MTPAFRSSCLDLADQEVHPPQRPAATAASDCRAADLQQVNPAGAPVLAIAINSPSLPVSSCTIPREPVAPKLSQVVAWGWCIAGAVGLPCAQADPKRGLAGPSSTTCARHRRRNVNQAKGASTARSDLHHRPNYQLKSAEYQKLVIAWRTATRCASASRGSSTIPEPALAGLVRRHTRLISRQRSPRANVIQRGPLKALLLAAAAALPASVDVPVIRRRRPSGLGGDTFELLLAWRGW